MSGINVGRVVVGGLAAGLVANGFDFIITTYLMEAEFGGMMARLHIGRESSQSWIGAFAVADFLWGLVLVFTYAAMRPRFGPGPKTAIISGVTLWGVAAITTVILLAMGLHSPQSYIKSAGLYLGSTLVCSLVGAALYRE